MKIRRRGFLALAGAAAVAPRAALSDPSPGRTLDTPMYGLIGKMSAVKGERETLAKILLDGTASMPGCLSYVIATDPADADALWITEVWDSKANHDASLSLPAVQAAIAKGRPLIAGFSNQVETAPLGGYGLKKA